MIIAAAVFSFLMGLGFGYNSKHSYLIIERDGKTVEVRQVKENKDQMAPFHRDAYGHWTMDCQDCVE